MKAWAVPPSHSQHSLVTQIYHQQNILGAQTLKTGLLVFKLKLGGLPYICIYISYIHNTVTWLGVIRPKESLHFTKQLRQNQRALSPTAWPAKGLSTRTEFFLSFLHHSPEISIIVMLLTTSHPKKRGESQAKALAKASSARKTRTSSPKGRTNLER